MVTPWWERPSLRFYLDWHLPDRDQLPPGTPPSGQALDVDGLVELAARAGAAAMIFPAKDNQGNVFWPSRLAHVHSAFADCDVVGEFVDALHARGLKAVPYFQPVRDKRWFDEVPAWRQVNNDGSDRVEQGWLQLGTGGHRLICPLGAGGEAMLALLEELVTSYEVDGVWWDRVGDVRGTRDRFACFCRSCQRAYQRETGEAIPTEGHGSSPAWRRFWHWRNERLLAFQARARAIVNAARPGAALLSNEIFLGMALVDPMPLSSDPERTVGATDVAVVEYQHFRAFLTMSLNPRLMTALADRPVDVMAWNASAAGDGVVRSPLASEAAFTTFVGLGHSATFQDTADRTGRLDPRTGPMMIAAFERAERHLAVIAGTEPVRHTALLYSPSTALWHRDGDNDLYHREFVGMARQALGEHVPFELVSERHLCDERLDGLSLLLLPDAACLADEAVAAIERWVAAGGVLLATHLASARDATGRLRPNLALADLLGVDVAGVSSDRATWMRATDGDPAGLGWEAPVALRAPTTVVTAREGSEIVAELATLLPGFDVFAHYLDQVRRWGPRPAVTRRRHGEGWAFYVAGLCGAADLQWGMPDLSSPIRAALARARPPLVRADAPSCVELIPRAQRGRLLVTLTNLQGEVGRTHRMATLRPTTQGIREVLPIHGLTLHLERTARDASERLHGSDVRLAGDGMSVTLSRLDVSAAVEILLA